MNEMYVRPRWTIIVALLAVAFGILTIVVGGKTLADPAEKAAAGNIVPFVLWFNFIAGFAYVVAGCGIFLRRRWAAHLSAFIALATVAVFVALGVHIALGGAFEARTIGAMTFRGLVWIAISLAVYRGFARVAAAT
jgi:hypothetical protein